VQPGPATVWFIQTCIKTSCISDTMVLPGQHHHYIAHCTSRPHWRASSYCKPAQLQTKHHKYTSDDITTSSSALKWERGEREGGREGGGRRRLTTNTQWLLRSSALTTSIYTTHATRQYRQLHHPHSPPHHHSPLLTHPIPFHTSSTHLHANFHFPHFLHVIFPSH